MNLKKLKKTKNFFNLINKEKQRILLFFLFSFSVYCALIIGKSWDEDHALLQGKSTLDYLFSLGKIDKHFVAREYYSSFYWSLQYLLTTIFPSKYQIEISHIINLIFSLATIIGISQVGKELFNKRVGKIIFLILFFYPIFFGHMSINYKDTILAFSHVWITLLILKYLRKQHCKDSINNYFIIIGALAALSMGIQFFFLGSLIPIFLFVLFEIFFFKKIIDKNFNKKKFLYDLIKCFIVFYFLLILFWIDVHQNILILPFKIFMTILSYTTVFRYGWPFNLVNGNYYFSNEVPKLYFLINLIYKSPEYFLMTYLFFFILIFKSNIFFKKKFTYFNYKLYFIIFMLIFPNLVIFLFPFSVHDGARLFLWALPYFSIIPGLMIYYLIENFNYMKSKFTLLFLSASFIYFLFNFFMITPYQYTYLNIFTGEAKNRYQKFENDYWGTSIKELINYANFEDNKELKIATCGVNTAITKNYLEKKGLFIHKFVAPSESDYLIMTNRVTLGDEKDKDSKKIINCFDKYKGSDVFKVTRNGLILSVIRKIKT